MQIKYTLCITCFNEVATVQKSLEGLVGQIDDEYEIVVVDGYSTDGTFEILRKYQNDPRVKLIQKKSNRGSGRQTAFENSSGEYVISNLDMDDIFLPKLREFVDFYHANSEGKVLLANAEPGVTVQNVTMAPTELLKLLGGWRNLQWSEDWDLWCRAAKANKYAWTVFRLVDFSNTHPERGKVSNKMRKRYALFRDMLRVGRYPFSKGENVSLAQRFAYIAALLSLPFYRSYRDKFNKDFNPYDLRYCLH